jgi:hypothetical protein
MSDIPGGMWFVVAAGVLTVLIIFVLIPLVDWWYDWDRRPARFHPDECRCGNCNDYHGTGIDGRHL